MYRGWIPTVNGRLSFRIIGDTAHPNRSVAVNQSIGSHRYVLAFQQRFLSDLLFYPIMARLLGKRGRFWFLLCSRVRDDASLFDSRMCGVVFVFSDALVWSDLCRNRIQPLQTRFYRFGREGSSCGGSAEDLRESYVKLLDDLDLSAKFKASVCIARDGVTTSVSSSSE